MFRIYIILFFCSLNLNVFSQKTLNELLPKNEKLISSFVPEGWLMLHSTYGDFNNDGLRDVAVVLIDSIKEKITGDGNRSLIILEGTKSGYILSGYCDSAYLCFGCGGVHGDPFESLKFADNILVLKHIVGSSYRSQLITRFRYMGGDWFLIGEKVEGCYINARCEKLKKFGGLSLYDKNYLTGEYVCKEVDEVKCMVKINESYSIEKMPLKKLTDYNITEIWNITR